MLDLHLITEQWNEVYRRLEIRGGDISGLEKIGRLGKMRQKLIQLSEGLRHELKQRSKQVQTLLRSDADTGYKLRKNLRNISVRQKELDAELKRVEDKLFSALLEVPNLPHASVCVGMDKEDNSVIRTVGEKPVFNFSTRPHWEIGERLGLMDFSRAAKLSGSRFTVLTGLGARLERALVNFMLDMHTAEHGYTEVLPPFLVQRDIMTGTGQLPKFEHDAFKTVDPELFLVPTAEVPLVNLHRGEILDFYSLPIKYVAYTPCFRREVGAYGRDTHGLTRQHQFDKVELVEFIPPEHSYEELEILTAHAEEVLKRLGLHYRVVSLCGGELGFSAAKTYDLEAWMPYEKIFREVSSCSNCEDFQARRAQIRFQRGKGQKSEFIHTLNGSGLAVGRTMASLLECCQQADGTIVLPEALVQYTGFQIIQN